MFFNEHFLRGVLPESVVIAGTFPEDATFSIDSRTIQQGEIFVALKGNVADGHDYISEAMKNGAAGIIIALDKKDIIKQCDPKLLKGKLVIAVRNTQQALYDLAAAWRLQFNGKILAITGSVGKTTTKEMTAAIIREHGKTCFASKANQNTKLGVALNLLRLRSHHEFAIQEVGINKRGEMANIADLLHPDIALITAIGHSHMEGLGSIAEIAAEKRMIFKNFTAKNIGIIHGDQPLLSNVSYAHPVVRFGFKSVNQVQARKVSVQDNHLTCTLKIYNDKSQVRFEHVHQGILVNTLAASAAAYLLEIPATTIIKAIQNPVTIPGRFERRMLKNKKGFLINDAYNANPESMKTALASFASIKSKKSLKKIVVIGDMLELGVHGQFWHRQLGRTLRKLSVTHDIILVGTLVQLAKKSLPVGAQVDSVATWQEVIPLLDKKLTTEQVHDESLVLVKGSHGIGLCNIAEHFTEPKNESSL